MDRLQNEESSGELDYAAAVRTFFRERLEFYLRDVLGFKYDVVNAVLAAGSDDVMDAVARAEAVTKVRPSADFESISIAFKRIKTFSVRQLKPEIMWLLQSTWTHSRKQLKRNSPLKFRERPRWLMPCASNETTNMLS